MGMTFAITGAAGFIGNATVNAALHRGHKVRALVRKNTPSLPEGIETIELDLSSDRNSIERSLSGVDAVIHAAGRMRSDRQTATQETVQATELLLSCLSNAAPNARLVLVSSIAVYDADARDINEDTLLEMHPETRDAYAQAKLAQEACLHHFIGECWIARPGAVYGPGRLWNAHLGFHAGPLLIRLGKSGEIPLIYVENCAEALVIAAETPIPNNDHRALNLIDGQLPDRSQFLSVLGHVAPRIQLPFPSKLLSVIGTGLGLIPGLSDRLPGLLRPRTLHARIGEKYYSNARAEKELGWHSRVSFDCAMRTSLETGK